MIVSGGDKRRQFSVEGAIAFQRVAAHFRHGPVAILEIMRHVTIGTTLNGVFHQGMIGNDRQAIVFALYAANKTGQERLNQLFRIGNFTILIGLQDGDHAIAVHDFFMNGGGMK